jgi:hypothetical protein
MPGKTFSVSFHPFRAAQSPEAWRQEPPERVVFLCPNPMASPHHHRKPEPSVLCAAKVVCGLIGCVRQTSPVSRSGGGAPPGRLALMAEAGSAPRRSCWRRDSRPRPGGDCLGGGRSARFSLRGLPVAARLLCWTICG